MDLKMKNSPARVIVIVGDGELNEGTVWEAVLVANSYKLNNLTFVVDRNHFQANKATEELIPLEPLQDKFTGFGCKVKRIDGHSFEQLEATFNSLPFSDGNLNVIIADTVRGKGLPSIEARADRWFCNFTHKEVEALMRELHGAQTTELTSETLTVR
jgi:transketolase